MFNGQTTMLYYARGKTPDGKQFKIVRGEARRVHEARGEDTFNSHFAAIFAVSKAMKRWRVFPIEVVFDIHSKEVRSERI